MIADRLREVIEYSRLSQTAFAKKLGLTQANLWRQLNGQRINAGTLEAIVEAFPEISCEWLLRDDGPMLKEDVDAVKDKRINDLLDVISMLQDKIKQLQNQQQQ